MSGDDIFEPIPVVLVAALIGGFVLSLLVRSEAREKFLMFCTAQNIPYAKCKEEWEKP